MEGPPSVEEIVMTTLGSNVYFVIRAREESGIQTGSGEAVRGGFL